MAANNTASAVNVGRVAQTAPRAITQSESAVLGMVGITERGPFTLTEVRSLEAWKLLFGGYTANNLFTASAVEGFFTGGGTHMFFARTVHHTTTGDPTSRTSTAATLDLLSAEDDPTAGSVTSSNTAPFALAHGDTIIVKIDGGSNHTATISAVAASRTSANTAPFSLVNNDTLTVAIDGATAAVVTFVTAAFSDITAATAAEVCAAINARFATLGIAAVATVSTGAVVITSSKKGTGSGVNVSAGSAQGSGKLNFTSGLTSGTGNVVSVAAVTVAELKTMIELVESGATVSDVSGAVKITSDTTGASSSVQVISTSTADDEIGWDNASHTGSDGTAVTTLTVDAEHGEYGNDVTVIVAAATSGDADYFNISFAVSGVTKQTFVNCSMDSTDPRYVLTVVNGNNTLGLTLTDADVGLIPATGTLGPMTGGDDGLTSLADSDFSGGVTANGKTGLRLLDGTEEVTLLSCPQRATAAVANAMNTYADITRVKSMFVLHDPPASLTAAGMVTYTQTTAALTESVETAAIYWPRIKVASPDETLYGSDPVVIPPSGDIAGRMARLDSSIPIGGSFLSPGGTDIGIPRMLGLETTEVLDKSKRDLLCAVRVNPISKEAGTTFFIDGVLTLLSTGDFDAVGQSRGVVMVAKSLRESCAYARHKNNTPELRASLADNISQFLAAITAAGVLASRANDEAFYVDVGPGLNPPSVQRTRAIEGRIGIAPADPADFINLNIFRDTRAAQAELAAAVA